MLGLGVFIFPLLRRGVLVALIYFLLSTDNWPTVSQGGILDFR